MHIYAWISIVMVCSFIFLAGILASPYKSILLPINIPVQFNFESVQLIDPRADHGSSYEIVVLARDGNELLRLKPEEAHNALQIVASDISGSGKLVWGSSNNLNFYATSDETFRPLKVSLNGPFALDGNTAGNFETVGTESGFQGLIGVGAGNESIVVEDFKWPLAGKSIPIAGGKAETGSWVLTAKSGSPIQMVTDDDQTITLKYTSLFTSTYLFAEDVTTKQRMPIAFETTIHGSINPSPSELPSYINSQIYLQVFGWLAPVGALMTIVWADDRYRRRIRKMQRRELLAE